MQIVFKAKQTQCGFGKGKTTIKLGLFCKMVSSAQRCTDDFSLLRSVVYKASQEQ